MINSVGHLCPHNLPGPYPKHPPTPENLVKDAPGMKGYRQRDKKTGRLKQKRSDTYLSSLEKTYGEFSDRHGSTTLGELRKITEKTGIKNIIKTMKAMEQEHGRQKVPKVITVI
jgi:hypothetical protein